MSRWYLLGCPEKKLFCGLKPWYDWTTKSQTTPCLKHVYPLVNVYIAMENHHVQLVNPLFLWQFSIAMETFTRAQTPKWRHFSKRKDLMYILYVFHCNIRKKDKSLPVKQQGIECVLQWMGNMAVPVTGIRLVVPPSSELVYDLCDYSILY